MILLPASWYGPHWCLIGGGFLAVNYIQVHLQKSGNITFVFREISVESIQLVFQSLTNTPKILCEHCFIRTKVSRVNKSKAEQFLLIQRAVDWVSYYKRQKIFTCDSVGLCSLLGYSDRGIWSLLSSKFHTQTQIWKNPTYAAPLPSLQHASVTRKFLNSGGLLLNYREQRCDKLLW